MLIRLINCSSTSFTKLQERKPFIPPKLIERRQKGLKAIKDGEKSERELEMELGDDYILDLKKRYDIPDEEKYDIPPEIWQGQNVADYIDPHIMQQLEKLEKEEEKRAEEGFYSLSSDEDEEVEDVRLLAREIRERKALMKAEARLDHTVKPRLTRAQTARKRDRSVSGLRSSMSTLGVDLDSEGEAHYDREAIRSATREAKRPKLTEPARDRSVSEFSRSESCMRDPKMIEKARHLKKKVQATKRTLAKKGEGDRTIPNLRPKHLLSGKRKLGKTSRR